MKCELEMLLLSNVLILTPLGRGRSKNPASTMVRGATYWLGYINASMNMPLR